MRKSAFRSFSDPDEYHLAARAVHVTGLWPARASFHAELTRVDLGRVWMQRFSESSARSAWVVAHPSRSVVLFRMPGGRAAFRHGGVDFDEDTILSLGAGAADGQTTKGPVEFGTMSLSPADLARFGPLLAERDLIAPRATTVLRARPDALARLRFLHAAAARLARTNPSRIEHPQISRAFEDSFTTAMVACLGGAERGRSSHAAERRAALIRRMEEYIEAQGGSAVYVAELCAQLCVTERSLERACHDHLGMAPKRYLWLRRLHMARRALLASEAPRTTVAEVALAHGFWELGRFAVQYHRIFGEPPSATLRGYRKRPAPKAALWRPTSIH